MRDVLAGLRTEPKHLLCKYFYDQRGSALFERICQLDEYYLTRSELAIMDQFAPEMGAQIGPGAMLVEYGSGSSVKTRYLLDALSDAVAYVPVDISGELLRQSSQELARDYPRIEILPVCADFTRHFALPLSTRDATHVAVYFPGSTIGNFLPSRAAELLRRIARLCGAGGGLLIGIDLKKDAAMIEAAYNDRLGVTAEFNLNLLHRMNRELDADFHPESFAHRAVWNSADSRMEMHAHVPKMGKTLGHWLLEGLFIVISVALGFWVTQLREERQSHELAARVLTGLQAEVLPFLHDMADRYRWADLVLCRAGASTLAELTICGKPAILVPYPYAADDHQPARGAEEGARGGWCVQSCHRPRRSGELRGRALRNRAPTARDRPA
jgi:dimethylhistidine N-methyltransferase